MIDQETMFWIYILYPVISGEVTDASNKKYFIGQCSKLHKLPDGEIKKISVSTCQKKLRRYKKNGIAGILRIRRSDKGLYRNVPNHILNIVKDLYKQKSQSCYKEINLEIKNKYEIDIPRSTFYRIIKDAKSKGLIPDKERTISIETDLNNINAKLLKMIVNGYAYKEICQKIPYSHNKQNINRIVSDEVINQLENLWKSSCVYQKRRICILMLYFFNYKNPEIQKITDFSKSTIQRVINDFNRFGKIGRKKRKENPSYTIRKKRLIEILHAPPSEYDINRTSWSALTLKKVYKDLYGKELGKSTVTRIIRASGYSVRKARCVLTSPDPKYREKVDLLIKTLHSLTDKDELFFIDEAGPYRIKKYGGRAYIEKGHLKTVPQNQPDKGSVTFSAALGAQNNQVTWHYHKSKDSNGIINLIELLFNQYHHLSRIYLSWDAASWHSSNKLTEWLDYMNSITREKNNGPGIILIPLPSNAQFLDVIESIFAGIKKAVIHNSDYQLAEKMKTAISRHLYDRNNYFKENPKRVGKKIWEIDFFQDYDNLKSGNYRVY